MALAFLPQDEAIATDATQKHIPIAPGGLRYAHFEIQTGKDGFPIELGAGVMAGTGDLPDPKKPSHNWRVKLLPKSPE